MIKVKCVVCGKEFLSYPSRIKSGKGKYCSHTCQHKNYKVINKGEKNPFYGKKHTLKSRSLMGREVGYKISEETRSKFRKRIGSKNPFWKGGIIYIEGYKAMKSYNHPLNKKGYIFEHRLNIEAAIGRQLDPSEIVHHQGEITDNRLEKLICFSSQSAHMRFHKDPNRVKPEEIIFDGRLLKH